MREQAAFPHEFEYGDGSKEFDRGMTLREYAAIHLRVPNSGNPELDDMIRDAVLRELAARAMQSVIVTSDPTSPEDVAVTAKVAHIVADAMLKEREK